MSDENVEGQRLGHFRMIEFGEAEGRLAEFAVFLLGVGQPLHQAVLVDELDAATAFAGIEERLVRAALYSAYSAGICIGCRGRIVGWVLLGRGGAIAGRKSTSSVSDGLGVCDQNGICRFLHAGLLVEAMEVAGYQGGRAIRGQYL